MDMLEEGGTYLSQFSERVNEATRQIELVSEGSSLLEEELRKLPSIEDLTSLKKYWDLLSRERLIRKDLSTAFDSLSTICFEGMLHASKRINNPQRIRENLRQYNDNASEQELKSSVILIMGEWQQFFNETYKNMRLFGLLQQESGYTNAPAE